MTEGSRGGRRQGARVVPTKRRRRRPQLHDVHGHHRRPRSEIWAGTARSRPGPRLRLHLIEDLTAMSHLYSPPPTSSHKPHRIL